MDVAPVSEAGAEEVEFELDASELRALEERREQDLHRGAVGQGREKATVNHAALLNEFAREGNSGPRRGDLALTTVKQRAALEELEIVAREVESPLQRLEHSLNPIVAFGIMPLFALANAGVLLKGDALALLTTPVSMGIILGLVIGKPLGIGIFAWLAVKSGIAFMPKGVTWRQIMGAACLGGVGFTMSIFVSGLAFDDATLITEAKLGILVASVVAGLAGYLLLRSSANSSEASSESREVT